MFCVVVEYLKVVTMEFIGLIHCLELILKKDCLPAFNSFADIDTVFCEIEHAFLFFWLLIGTV